MLNLIVMVSDDNYNGDLNGNEFAYNCEECSDKIMCVCVLSMAIMMSLTMTIYGLVSIIIDFNYVHIVFIVTGILLFTLSFLLFCHLFINRNKMI